MDDQERVRRDVPVTEVTAYPGQPPLRDPLIPTDECKHPEERVWWVSGVPYLGISLNAYDARCLDCGEVATFRPQGT